MERLKEKHPLMKTPSLQSAVADFKRRVRLISKVSTHAKDEWHLETCTSISNRLEPLAIASRQAAIRGMPAIEKEDSKYIARAILAMRGVNQKFHKKQHADGTLMILQKPFAYKGTSHVWMRNIVRPAETQDWTKEPALPDGPPQRKKPLKTIECPECGTFQSTKAHRLQVKVGFCMLTCQACRSINSTKHWKCHCGEQWYKCEVHVQQRFLMQ